jgi:hypothetical protein
MDSATQDLLSTLISTLIPAVGTILGVTLSYLVWRYTKFIEEKQVAQQIESALRQLGISERMVYLARETVIMLVQSAEQAGLKDELLKSGAEKKAWVLERAQARLAELGVTGIDLEALSDMVESAIHQGYKQAPVWPVTSIRSIEEV